MQRRDFFRNIGNLAVGSAILHATAPRAWATVIRVPQDFSTIQAAVDAAEPGDTIHIAAGVYNETVLINKSDLRLRAPVAAGADRTVIQGPVGGTAIQVLGTPASPVSGIEIMGFVVENAGIQLNNAVACRIHLNEVRNIVSFGVATSPYGIRLISSSFNEVTQNFVHDCIEGILLNNGSSANTIRGNHTLALGLSPVATFACGIQVGGATIGGIPGGNNNNNLIAENEFLQTYWGIQLSSAPANTGNLLAQNRCHENQRAGIGINGPSNSNLIRQNNCTGNGLGNLAPSGTFDLFDAPPNFDNLWERNQGTSNF